MPEEKNLNSVFFKIESSKTMFRQIVWRGTRLELITELGKILEVDAKYKVIEET